MHILQFFAALIVALLIGYWLFLLYDLKKYHQQLARISEMLATILAADYTVQQAYSGTEGLLLFQQDAFDLILLDRMLPGKDGTQVLQEIRQTSTVPVIILTALDEPADVSTLLLAGANDYLTKPFNVEELKARIIVQLRTNKQAPPVASSLSYKNI